MECCPVCNTPYGKRHRCYVCQPVKVRTGQLITCEWCGKKKYVQQNQLDNEACRFCSRKCQYASMKGKPHPSGYNPRNPLLDERLRKDGYIEIKVGHEGTRGIYELEHRFMMALLRGRHLEREEEVHHKDLDRAHNCPGNLAVIPSGEHQRFHNAEHPAVRILKICQRVECGREYRTKPSRIDSSRFCSNACKLAEAHEAVKAYHAVHRVPSLMCAYCAQAYYVPEHRLSEAQFCSAKCLYASQRKPVAEKICEHCGQSYKPRWASAASTSRFCSRACWALHQGAHLRGVKPPLAQTFHPAWDGVERMDYGPAWQAQRLLARARDGYRCQHCGVHEGMLCEELTVAHYVAFKMFSPVERAQANALENLISLCRPCHTAFDHQQGVRVSVGGG